MTGSGLAVGIQTPRELVWSGTARLLVVRALDGELGVLPGHAPLVAALPAGVVRVLTGTGEERLAVSGGVLVVDGGGATVLALAAERAGAIDVARAEAARDRARQRLAGPEHQRARAGLERALARLRAAAQGADYIKRP